MSGSLRCPVARLVFETTEEAQGSGFAYAYQEMRLERGINEALADQVRGERIGRDRFLRTTFGHDPPIAEIPRAQIEPLPPDLNEIFKTSANPVATAYRRHGYTLRQIGEHLGCHYSTISRRLRREENQTAA
ncbi:MAG: helix-turn-helix domain-containing protein [Gaiellaceae bacterium]